MNSRSHQTPKQQGACTSQQGRSILRFSRQMLEFFRHACPRWLAPCRIAALLLALNVLCSPVSAVEPTLYGASLGPEVMYTQASGDSWYATWADDGDLYVTSDDTTGFSGNCVSKQPGGPLVNIAISHLRGDDPMHLTGEAVNCMEAYDVPQHSTSWKTTGITCIDGTLYLFVEQDIYFDAQNFGRQTARDATIVKSTDHGKTWSGSVAENIAHPMFPGRRFGAPSFIQYGRDGTGGVDGGETYVYAISNDGSWDNGSSMVIGRVSRSNLPRLRGEDWEFYADGKWTHDLDGAQPILRGSNLLSSASSMYVPTLHKYILASWYYPDCTGNSVPGCDVRRTRWVWYEAPKPWGPWKKLWEPEWFPGGYYNPILVNKFLSPDGTSGWVFSAGYFYEPAWYRLIAAPFMLDLARRTIINDSDLKAITYHGRWTYAKGGLGEYNGGLHYTTDPAASATLHFRGTGVRVLTDVGNSSGTVEFYLDGRLQGIASARHHNADTDWKNTQLAQRVLWSSPKLALGEHSLQLRKRDGVYMVVDAFVVTREEQAGP